MAEEILVVDDHPANLLAVKAALGHLAPGMVPAQSGREALRLLLDRDFAVILLDVRMPELDGISTARLIRGRQRSRNTPIIFVTAHACDEQEVLDAYALGAVDFLFKPIVAEVLQAKVNAFVELRRRTLELAEQKEKLREMEHAHRIAEALADADRRKNEFLAILGHELRNPLAPITAGLELLRRQVRGTFGPSEVRMVAMTGFGQEDDRRRALEAGFDAHLVKPADLDVLLEAIAPT